MVESHTGIFGSPPEPIFNVRPHGMKVELLEDWLLTLANENVATVKISTHRQGHFKDYSSAEFLFLMCEKLRLSAEAKYLAIEMLDRFMVKHIQDLYSHVLSLATKNQKQELESILERVRTQVPLRVVSCCQISSKLTSHYRIISPRRVQRTLQDFGHQYNLSSILQSELRILKTLDYKVMITTPLVYVETILEILGHNNPQTEVKIYYGICTSVLDYLYMRRSQLYEQLYELATRNTTPSLEKRRMFATVENDNMLLAVTVIAVVSYLKDQQKTPKVMEGLSQITRIPKGNIWDFASIIIQHLLSGD